MPSSLGPLDQDVDEEIVSDVHFPQPSRLLHDARAHTTRGWLPSLHANITNRLPDPTALWQAGTIGWARVSLGCSLNRLVIAHAESRTVVTRFHRVLDDPPGDAAGSSPGAEDADLDPLPPDIVEVQTNYSEYVRLGPWYKLERGKSGTVGEWVLDVYLRARSALLAPYVKATETSTVSDTNNLGFEIFRFCDQFYWMNDGDPSNRTITVTRSLAATGQPVESDTTAYGMLETSLMLEEMHQTFSWAYALNLLHSLAIGVPTFLVTSINHFAFSTVGAPSEDSMVGALSRSPVLRRQASLGLGCLCLVLLVFITLIYFRYSKYTGAVDTLHKKNKAVRMSPADWARRRRK